MIRGSNARLFSVLVANYNRGKFIREMIESIIHQTYTNLELVIVDDGSTDNSVEIIRQLMATDDRIRLHCASTNTGCGSAMLQCAQLAKGEWMGYVGSDDTLQPDAVEIMVQAHQKNPSCSLIYSTHYVCDETLTVQRLAYSAESIPPSTNYLVYGKGVTSFATFTKFHYLKTEGINGSYKRAVDQDLYYKLEEVGDLLYVDKPLYNYRVNSLGISTQRNISKARYWFVRAKEDAYTRRKSNTTILNITRKELDAWWSIMYITKSSSAFQQWRICKGFYWLLLSLTKSIFDKYFLVKLKSFFLNTWVHTIFSRMVRL